MLRACAQSGGHPFLQDPSRPWRSGACMSAAAASTGRHLTARRRHAMIVIHTPEKSAAGGSLLWPANRLACTPQRCQALPQAAPPCHYTDGKLCHRMPRPCPCLLPRAALWWRQTLRWAGRCASHGSAPHRSASAGAKSLGEVAGSLRTITSSLLLLMPSGQPSPC